MEPEKNEHMQILLDNIETQIWYLKDEKTYGMVNQAHADFFGVQKEELQNKDLYELMSTREEAEECIAGNQEVFTKKQKVHGEELVLNGKGEERLLSITKTPMFDDNNNVEYVVCSAEDITGRKETERKLKLLLNEHETVFQGVQDAIFLVEVIDDNTFRFIRNNQAHAQATGLSSEIIKGKTPQELLGEKPGDSVAVNYRRCVSDAATISYEETLDLPGGLRIWHTTLSPVLEQNEVTHIVGSSRDITERKQADEELQKNEEKLRSILDNMTDVVWSISWPDFNPLYISPSVERIYGISEQEFYDNPTIFKEITHLDDQHLTEKAIEQLQIEGEAIRECRVVKPDGSIIWINDRSKLIFDDNQRPVRVEGVAQDITERKRFEEELSRSEERFQKMLSLITDMISIHDPDMNIIYSNWNGFGAVPEEKKVLNTKCYRTYRDRDDICPDCHAITVLHTKEAFQEEVRLPEGNWVDLRVIPILGEDGSVELVVEWVKDITAQKQAEHDIQNLVENAPDMIVRFNAKLENIYCNAAVEQYFGVPKEYLLGKTFEELAREDQQGVLTLFKARQMEEALEHALIYGSEQEVEMSFDFTTESKHFWTRIAPEKNEEGTVETLLAVSRDVTSQKQTENKLKENQELFNKVLEATNDGIWDWNVLTGEAYLSNNYYTMLGYAPGDFEPNFEDWRSSLHPEDREGAERQIEECFAGKEDGYNIEFRAKTKEGGYKWIHSRGKIVETDENGNPTRAVGSHIDINEKKEQEEMVRSIINAAQTVALIVTDLNSIVKEFSPGAESILGHSREEILGTHVGPFHSSLDVQKFPEYIEKLRRNREGFTMETELVRKSGEYFPARFTLQPLFDNEGNLSGTLGISIDISDLKETERKLRESEEKFKMLAELSPLAILMYQNDYWVYANPAAEQISGYSIDELYNMQFWDFIHPDYKEVVKSLGKKRQEDIDDQTPYEFKIITKQGLEKWIFLSGSTVHYQGASAGMINCMDITESKQTKHELQRAYAMLENEIEKASHIHEKILPQNIPQPRNISIAAHFQPAETIGGDFYHVIHHEGKLIFYLSDVSGHGLDGAMVSVFIKEAIDSYIQLKPDKITPGRIIEYLSKQYYRENYPDDQLICIFVGVIDLEYMNLSYSSVGFQNHPLVHWGSGGRGELETSGLFISNMVPYELLNFEESSVSLDDGTTIMFSTDGLTEQKSGEELFYQYVEEVFYRYSHFTPEIIVQAVNQEFCLFNNHSLVGDDDITFLVLQVGNQSHQHKNYCFEIPSDL